MDDYLFRGALADLDPAIYELTELEAERQAHKLILIASESSAPLAVREALASSFQNIYAEGYPDERTRGMTEAEILDYPARLAYYRRLADPRYYKGVEYCDTVESLARRRCAEAFAANGYSAQDIFVNVQALSGAAANNAIYHALAEPGDTFMGLELVHGGHLTHGSPVNRSGKYYKAVHYSVDPQTEQIDYDAVDALARQHKPKFIIAGYSSYPWAVDWKRMRLIADAVGATLFADIAHVAGMVAAGVYPSPVGYAQVITFTTHKSLCGPRGACILTTEPELARTIDRAVFPGEQGGPHVNVFGAMALTFKLAQTEQFHQLMAQVITNASVLAQRLGERGLRISYGGTDTHLLNIDCRSVRSLDGATLSGDRAVRILDIAGIVANRQTIPGDESASDPSGVRLGTVWLTQRGFKEAETIELADIIADVLLAVKPYIQEGRRGKDRRAKVDFNVLEDAKLRVRRLAEGAGIDFKAGRHGYPHFFYIDDAAPETGERAFTLSGEKVRMFVNYAFGSDAEALQPGECQPSCLVTPKGTIEGLLGCLGPRRFQYQAPPRQMALAGAWLRDLSDGYVLFDPDLHRKLPGPIVVEASESQCFNPQGDECFGPAKPYAISGPLGAGDPLPDFVWQEFERPLRRTPVYELHRRLGAKMIPFAGWEMPVWYSSVLEEHQAVRQVAGLFDVTHMGVYQAEGPEAVVFLNSVTGNDIGALAVGDSCYTHFLDPQADVIDDLLVYRRSVDKYLLVVNASNDDKDWTWLNAVKDGKVRVDLQRPWARAFGRNVILRNLRDPKEGADMRVDIALQGPRSQDILLSLDCDEPTQHQILNTERTHLLEAVVGGFDLVVSRTGYTGEKMAYELFVHPDQATALCEAILKAGQPFGIKPCGLGARDSLRTEAGLPLYGHEMGGDLNLGVAEAGFGFYVKTYKPWFIGRQAYLEREKTRKTMVVRFRFMEKGVRMAHLHDPVLDRRGRVIGEVTSCAVDQEGILTGQASIELKYTDVDTLLYIYQSASKEAPKAPADMKPGDRTTLPTPAVVMSRFL